MDYLKVKRTDAPLYRVGSSEGTDAKPSGSFQRGFEEQLRRDCKKRVTELFDEIKEEAEDIFTRMDMGKFEKYRSKIMLLLNEIASGAYSVKPDLITDKAGNRRVMTLVTIIDEKLDELASELLSQNAKAIDYLGRIDEIRGLLLDLLC